MCKGSVGSQVSIQCGVGSNVPVGDVTVVRWCELRLVVLFWREKEGVPAGILPLAFSDMPRNCGGSGSSIEEEIEGLREWRSEGEEWEGVGGASWSEVSESSSSPIANALPSSGTLLREVEWETCGLRKLSTELSREFLVGLVGFDADAASFRS